MLQVITQIQMDAHSSGCATDLVTDNYKVILLLVTLVSLMSMIMIHNNMHYIILYVHFIFHEVTRELYRHGDH